MGAEKQGCTILFLGPDPPPGSALCRIEWVPLLAWHSIDKSSIILNKIYKYFDSIVLSSPRAVKAVYKDAEKYNILDKIKNIGKKLQVYSIGPSTSAVAEGLLGWSSTIPPLYTVVELARLVSRSNASRVLGLRSPSANRALQEILLDNGKVYLEHYVYHTRVVSENIKKINNNVFECIAVTSSSIAGLVKRIGLRGEMLSIGPETTQTLTSIGLDPVCTAEEYTLRGVISCAEKYCKNKNY